MNNTEFIGKLKEYEMEKASNSYLMSIVFLTIGMPLPFVNLIGTIIFWSGNKNESFFVRWHCMQAFLTQFTLFIVNIVGLVWAANLYFKELPVNNWFISYLLTLLIFNLLEFIATIAGAVQTRKGIHLKWFFYGCLTDLICRK